MDESGQPRAILDWTCHPMMWFALLIWVAIQAAVLLSSWKPQPQPVQPGLRTQQHNHSTTRQPTTSSRCAVPDAMPEHTRRPSIELVAARLFDGVINGDPTLQRRLAELAPSERASTLRTVHQRLLSWLAHSPTAEAEHELRRLAARLQHEPTALLPIDPGIVTVDDLEQWVAEFTEWFWNEPLPDDLAEASETELAQLNRTAAAAARTQLTPLLGSRFVDRNAKEHYLHEAFIALRAHLLKR